MTLTVYMYISEHPTLNILKKIYYLVGTFLGSVAIDKLFSKRIKMLDGDSPPPNYLFTPAINW